MAGSAGETGAPEPSDHPHKAEQGILEATAIVDGDNLLRDCEKRDNADNNSNLCKVAGPIPVPIWLAMLLTAAERFSFYGMTAPFMNFMQNGGDDALRPGALRWGESRASEVSNVFYILSLLTPNGASLAADNRLGRYNVLCHSCSDGGSDEGPS